MIDADLALAHDVPTGMPRHDVFPGALVAYLDDLEPVSFRGGEPVSQSGDRGLYREKHRLGRAAIENSRPFRKNVQKSCVSSEVVCLRFLRRRVAIRVELLDELRGGLSRKH